MLDILKKYNIHLDKGKYDIDVLNGILNTLEKYKISSLKTNNSQFTIYNTRQNVYIWSYKSFVKDDENNNISEYIEIGINDKYDVLDQYKYLENKILESDGYITLHPRINIFNNPERVLHQSKLESFYTANSDPICIAY